MPSKRGRHSVSCMRSVNSPSETMPALMTSGVTGTAGLHIQVLVEVVGTAAADLFATCSWWQPGGGAGPAGPQIHPNDGARRGRQGPPERARLAGS